MHAHRFRDSLEDTQPLSSLPTMLVSASGFMVCPLAVRQGMMGPAVQWQQLYQLAFEQARESLRDDRWRRQRVVLWN
jgi:hypothetical protein